MQEDPYFATGSAFGPEDENGNSTGLQMDNPDDPNTFYNAENWSGGIKKDFENQPSSVPVQEGDETAPFPFWETQSNEQAGVADQTELPTQTEGEIPDDGELPLTTDAAKGTDFNYKGTNFDFRAGYMASWSPAFIKKTFASYFDQYAGFQLLGFNLKADWLFLGKEKLKFGVGAYGSWSRIWQEEKHYEINAEQFNADLLLVFKVFTYDGFQIDIHAGGGFLIIGLEPERMTVKYENELVSDGTWWRYPEVRAGAGYEVFIYDHVGFSFSCDVAWPLLFENTYPKLDVTAGIVARF